MRNFRLRMDSTYGSGNSPARQSYIRSYAPFSDKVRGLMAADDWVTASALAKRDALNSVTPTQARNRSTSAPAFGKPSLLEWFALSIFAGITTALVVVPQPQRQKLNQRA